MSNLTIEKDIQEIILDVLPKDGIMALAVMAQLSANMLLSIKEVSLENYLDEIRRQYIRYVESE